jgi:hypothetical protein
MLRKVVESSFQERETQPRKTLGGGEEGARSALADMQGRPIRMGRMGDGQRLGCGWS